MHYGEYIREVERAREAMKACDFILILGSSCSVLRKYKFIFENHGSKHLVLVNLQWTGVDKIVDIKVHADVDVFMGLLLKEMGVE